ncbi:MAG: hypothetical protein OEM59_12420, partial [Rhodospirillales bacterium]|nr:hypothetical protein [Rhodospirillales bacterium]
MIDQTDIQAPSTEAGGPAGSALSEAKPLMSWITKPGRHVKAATIPVLTAGAFAVAGFIFDTSLPLGVAGGVPYVALVLIGLWMPWHRAPLVLAAVGVLLTLLGLSLSPEGGIPWVVWTNRALAIFAIMVTAIVCFAWKRAAEALQQSHELLETRVAERTAALSEENASRRQAEAALRESEQRFRHFAETSA